MSGGAGEAASSALQIAVQVAGRGRLPFELLHGEPLLAHVLQTAGRVGGGAVVPVVVDGESSADEVRRVARAARVGVDVVAASAYWSRPAGPVLLLDALCPLVPTAFVAELAALARTNPGVGLVAFRPVTDTVKSVVGGRVMGTIDRERLGIVTSPIVIPAMALEDGGTAEVPVGASDLVGWLRGRVPVELVRAPSVGRRVEDVASVHLLECVDEIARRMR
jgi:hypothetical protein